MRALSFSFWPAVTRAAVTSVLLGAALPSCGSSSSGGAPAVPVGGGVGDSCATAACRAGLTCNAKKVCAVDHGTTDGAPCTLRDECAAGSFCDLTRTCAAVVTAGAAADACASDGECGDGLRCDLIGLIGACEAEGSADEGSPCAAPAGCFAGLSCLGGKCAAPPAGTPALSGSSWSGATCGPEAAAGPNQTLAYFHVPRGDATDADFYRLPFPSDARTVDGHPDLSGHPTPGAALLGYDLMDRYLRAIEQSKDGFGAYPTVVFRFAGPIDVDSFRGVDVVSFVDLTPGAGAADVPLEWVASPERSRYVCANWLAVRPSEGHALSPGHTYAVILSATDAHTAHAAGGGAIVTDQDFEAVLADSPPKATALGHAYTAFAPLRAYLKTKPAVAAGIVDATVFTVASVTEPIARVAAAVQAAPAPVASGWHLCGSAGADPCTDVDGARGCGMADPLFDELHAVVALPVFQRGTAPYDTVDAMGLNGSVDLDATVPAVVRTEAVCLSLTVPKATTMPPLGWPVVIYAHDVGGSYRSHIDDGVSDLLAEAVAPSGPPTPVAVLGIDQVQHGPRRGASKSSAERLLFTSANPAGTLGTSLQGVADQLALARLAASIDLPMATSPTMQHVLLNAAAVGFWGHGQGAAYQAMALPHAPGVRGAVLSGMGAGFVDQWLGRAHPVSLSATVPFALEDASPAGLMGGKFNPALSLLQSFLDPIDPLHHALAATSGAAGHDVFQVYGIADGFTPAAAQATYAVAAELALVAPDPTVVAQETIPDAVAMVGSVSGNKTLPDGKTKVTAAVRQYQPDAGDDGHDVVRKNPVARTDVTIFLAGLLAGGVPTVGH